MNIEIAGMSIIPTKCVDTANDKLEAIPIYPDTFSGLFVIREANKNVTAVAKTSSEYGLISCEYLSMIGILAK